MRFEWDPRKAERNLKRRRISFAEASTVFYDPLAKTIADPDHCGNRAPRAYARPIAHRPVAHREAHAMARQNSHHQRAHPVMLVVRDGRILWMNVAEYLKSRARS